MKVFYKILLTYLFLFSIILSCSESKKIESKKQKKDSLKSKNNANIDILLSMAQNLENNSRHLKILRDNQGTIRFNFVDSSKYVGKEKFGVFIKDVNKLYPLLYFQFIYHSEGVMLEEAYFTFYNDCNSYFYVQVYLSSKAAKDIVNPKADYKYLMEQTDYDIFMYKVDVKKWKEFYFKDNPKKMKKDRIMRPFDSITNARKN